MQINAACPRQTSWCAAPPAPRTRRRRGASAPRGTSRRPPAKPPTRPHGPPGGRRWQSGTDRARPVPVMDGVGVPDGRHANCEYHSTAPGTSRNAKSPEKVNESNSRRRRATPRRVERGPVRAMPPAPSSRPSKAPPPRRLTGVGRTGAAARCDTADTRAVAGEGPRLIAGAIGPVAPAGADGRCAAPGPRARARRQVTRLPRRNC